MTQRDPAFPSQNGMGARRLSVVALALGWGAAVAGLGFVMLMGGDAETRESVVFSVIFFIQVLHLFTGPALMVGVAAGIYSVIRVRSAWWFYVVLAASGLALASVTSGAILC